MRVVWDTNTPAHAIFRLKRLADVGGKEAYQASVRIDFKPGDDEVTPAQIQRMEAKLDLCLADLDDYLTGPNGERLILRREKAEGRTDLPAVPIQVQARPVRGHSHMWDSRWQCFAMTHEFMHLLGQVDEYQEPARVVRGRTVQPFDCRALGPTHSIMAFPGHAYRMASPRIEMPECTCEGVPDPAACIADFPRLMPGATSCPASAKEVAGAFTAVELDRHEAPRTTGASPAVLRSGLLVNGRFRLEPRRITEKKSLLLPGQFEAIVHPGNLEKNAVFYRCAADAYRTSATQGGFGCAMDRPVECTGGDLRWLTR